MIRPVAAFLVTTAFLHGYQMDMMDDIFELDLEALQNVKVTTVSKSAQSLNDAPAQVVVVTREHPQPDRGPGADGHQLLQGAPGWHRSGPDRRGAHDRGYELPPLRHGAGRGPLRPGFRGLRRRRPHLRGQHGHRQNPGDGRGHGVRGRRVPLRPPAGGGEGGRRLPGLPGPLSPGPGLQPGRNLSRGLPGDGPDGQFRRAHPGCGKPELRLQPQRHPERLPFLSTGALPGRGQLRLHPGFHPDHHDRGQLHHQPVRPGQQPEHGDPGPLLPLRRPGLPKLPLHLHPELRRHRTADRQLLHQPVHRLPPRLQAQPFRTVRPGRDPVGLPGPPHPDRGGDRRKLCIDPHELRPARTGPGRPGLLPRLRRAGPLLQGGVDQPGSLPPGPVPPDRKDPGLRRRTVRQEQRLRRHFQPPPGPDLSARRPAHHQTDLLQSLPGPFQLQQGQTLRQPPGAQHPGRRQHLPEQLLPDPQPGPGAGKE